MAFAQKTWVNRVSEYINRRILTKEDGSSEIVTVERSEGTVSQEGDAFSAENMNDLEQRIADEFSVQNERWATLVELLSKYEMLSYATGTVSMGKVGTTIVTKTVTVLFDEPFVNVPTVTLSSNGYTSSLTATDITRTGFVINFKSSYSSEWEEVIVTWRAEAAA